MTAISESRPRLLVLTPSADLYGSDRSLLLALPALQERHDVVLVSAAEGPMLDEARALGVETHVTGDWALRRRMLQPRSLPTTSRRVRATLRLLRRLHEEQPFAAVYANTIANATLPFLPRTVPVPLIVHVRELPRDRPRQLRVLLRVVERVADVVICNSGFTAEAAIAIVPGLADRTRVVLNSVPPPARPVTPPAADGRFHIGCVGRLHPKKGQDVLIEATRMAALEGSDWHLHFHGDALDEHRSLERELHASVAAAGLTDRVTWHGYHADTDRLYDGLDVVVVPSVTPEEFSLVTAEAQVRGLPVVATGPGGPSEILADGRTGRIVAPRDPVALAAALRELETDPDRRRSWGEAGRRRATAMLAPARYRAEIARHVGQAAARTPTALVLSPSADLYGSDMALLHALPAITATVPTIVLTAAPGPFVAAARRAGAAAMVGVDFAARRRFLRPAHLPGSVWRSLRALVSMARLRRRRGIGLVYVNTVAVPVTPLLKPVLRVPVLVHLHERARGGATEAAVIRWSLRWGVDVLVANSAWTAASVAEGAQHRVRLVHNGIWPAPAREPRDESDEFRLVCVARIHPKKGQEQLVRAVALLLADGVDVRLEIVGDALPEHAELEASLRRTIRELQLEDRVSLLGYVDDPDEAYRRSDVVVVPSVTPEEFSLVAAEGQMRGLAAVVTGPGGVTEVVLDEETGLVVPPDDVAALADALGRLAADREMLAAMGAAGRQRMLEHFTVDRFRRQVVEEVAAIMNVPTGTSTNAGEDP